MKNYEINYFRSLKLNSGRYLLTVDSGDWIAISEKKFQLFNDGKVETDIMLFNVLKDKHIILTDENKDDYAQKLKQRYSHLYSTASLHIVAITKRCNHDCLYCHANAKISNDKNLDMDEKTAKKTVDFIFNSPNNNICIEFQGGEPLINFDIIKYIIEYSLEINIKYHKELKFALVTNLTLMDEEKLEFLMKHRVGLCTSLDGTKEIHDKNRQYIDGKGTYDNVINWIKKIKEDHKYPLEALMVTTMHSLKYPKEIIDEYMKFGFDHIQFRPMLNLGNAKNNDEMNVKAYDYLKFWKTAMNYLLEKNQKVKLIDRFTKYLLQKFFLNTGSSFVDLNSPCGGAISTLAYDHEGNIFTCDEGRQYDLFKLGTVDMVYSELFETNECQSFIKASVNDCLMCDKCVWKPFCGVCPVCNYVDSGNLIPCLSKNERCQILKGQFEFLMDKIIEDKNNEIFLGWIKKNE